jgi:hypothetical protein
MRLTIQRAFLLLAIIFSMTTVASAQTTDPVASADTGLVP